MKFDVGAREYRLIEELIASEESPVGIDAKKTHILILAKLLKIEEQLERLAQAQESV